MKINNEYIKNEPIFKDLQVGDVFLNEQGCGPYMKIDDVRNSESDFFNAVRLSNGVITEFVNNEIVHLVNAELTIK
jgi:hypothetical protein